MKMLKMAAPLEASHHRRSPFARTSLTTKLLSISNANLVFERAKRGRVRASGM